MTSKIEGQRFGRLVAVRDIGSKDKTRIWEFSCDCGGIYTGKSTAVKAGIVRSCGCLASELSSLRKRLKLDGLKFGRLTVIECCGPDKHGHVKWLCRCVCGNNITTSGVSLKKGVTKSCGCIRSELISALGKRSKKENPYSKTKEYRSELRRRLRENPAYAMAERTSRMICHTLSGLTIKKFSRTFDMLGYSPQELKEHIEKQFISGMSWDNRDAWQIDHIIPISRAKSIEDVIALNQLANLKPLWAKENNKKRAQIHSLL